MQLVRTSDFETAKKAYLGVIENTPQIEKHARWVYGKHPTDEMLKTYIERDEMYFLMDGDKIAGAVVISMSQGDDYKAIEWQDDLENDQVATVHLLAICPGYQGRSLWIRILEEAEEIAGRNGKKALRLDALKTNIPARRMYEKAGFSYKGEQRLYAENTGMTDFLFYERSIFTDVQTGPTGSGRDTELMKEYIDKRVHKLYWDEDLNCARTTLICLSELFKVPLEEQVLSSAIGLHGAGKYGAQCGLVEGSLMFIGILYQSMEKTENDIVEACYDFAKQFEEEFGSLRCCRLRPTGFSKNDPPHMCEQLTGKAVLFSYEYINGSLQEENG